MSRERRTASVRFFLVCTNKVVKNKHDTNYTVLPLETVVLVKLEPQIIGRGCNFSLNAQDASNETFDSWM